jgi:RimJ/RimL family protein N-acetyltransferase
MSMIPNGTPLAGKLVRLRGVALEDTRDHLELFADNEAALFMDVTPPPRSEAAIDDWTSWLARKIPTGPNRFFQIERLADGEHVGGLRTNDADPAAGAFSYGLQILQKHRGRGYARDAITVCLRFHCMTLRYESAHVYVFENNLASIRLHEQIGFTLEGRQRPSAFYRGELLDLLRYSIAKESFLKLHGA